MYTDFCLGGWGEIFFKIQFLSNSLVYLVLLFTWLSCLPGSLVYLVLLFTWFSCLPGSLVYLALLFTWFSSLPGSLDVRIKSKFGIKLY